MKLIKKFIKELIIRGWPAIIYFIASITLYTNAFSVRTIGNSFLAPTSTYLEAIMFAAAFFFFVMSFIGIIISIISKAGLHFGEDSEKTKIIVFAGFALGTVIVFPLITNWSNISLVLETHATIVLISFLMILISSTMSVFQIKEQPSKIEKILFGSINKAVGGIFLLFIVMFFVSFFQAQYLLVPGNCQDDDCNLSLSWYYNDVNYCDNIKNVFRQDNCYRKMAWNNYEPSYCEKISNSSDKYSCIQQAST